MKKIEGSPKNLKQLLQNTKYSIHYYQREYMWQRKQIEELIDDLCSEFLASYAPSHERSNVQDYGAYFMGSIVLAGRDNAIIDGQQRFSSLTLLLMYLINRLKAIGVNYTMLEAMVFSEAFGTKSFNINVEDRQECMSAIYKQQPFDLEGQNESVRNLYKRYLDIEELFPVEISDDTLLHFCDWLAEKVFFIEIVALTEQDAHKVFVTMNDRGLNLTSTEMLKGYILSEIKNDSEREKLNSVWKKRVIELKASDDKGDEVFIKAWLRAQYAETIRETKAGATNKDFDIIGGSFHKWVRDEKGKLGLDNPEKFEDFIREFDRFADIFIQIKQAEEQYSESTKYLYYNAQLNFTFQTQLILASICRTDTADTIREKMLLVAKFIDLFIYTRVVNYKSNDYNTVKNYVFTLTKKVRRTSILELKSILLDAYQSLDISLYDAIGKFRLNGYTKRYIKHMLARITGYVEECSGFDSNYCNYVGMEKRNPFEVEHIIPDHYEWYTEIFATPEEFDYSRNNIGSLLLLPKSINASLKDAKYEKKLVKYCSSEGNIYAGSLSSSTYSNNPGFKRFINEKSLNFKSYYKFEKDEIDERNKLVAQLVQLIWNTSSLED